MATTTTSLQTDWRREWFEIEDATYLNLASQSPMPKVSIRAVQAASKQTNTRTRNRLHIL